MLGQNIDGNPGSGSGQDLLLKEATSRGRERHASEQTLGSEGSLKENRPDNNNSLNGNRHKSPSPPRTSTVEKLFHHGHCLWPGCDTALPDSAAFFRHLAQAHTLDDKATAQTRVQMQIVSQLELQLGKNQSNQSCQCQWHSLPTSGFAAKEKDRLNGMMKHLNLEQTKSGDLRPVLNNNKSPPPPGIPTSHLHLLQSSVDRASDLGKPLAEQIKVETGRKTSPPEVAASRMAAAAAAAAAMFPNLPTSLAATLGFNSPPGKYVNKQIMKLSERAK